MIAAIASAALLVAGSLIVGQGVNSLCGRREWTPLAAPVGLAVLLVVSGFVAGFGGRGPAVAIALGVVLIAALLALAWGRGGGGGRHRLRSMDARTPADKDVKPPVAGTTPFAAPAATPFGALLAAVLAALFAAIPFIAAGHVGILGVGLVNDDMASHLLLADWIDERFRPEPVFIDQGYPLGPHALVAGFSSLLGASSIDVFAGLTLAIPALTALVAYTALGGLRGPARVGASALVALPYLAAAYLAQEAFKEPVVALFLLTFALLLPTVRGWRDAIPLGVLAAGTVYVYSFPGLAWLGGVVVIWALIGVARDRGWGPFAAPAGETGPAPALADNPGHSGPGLSRHAALVAVGAGLLALLVLVAPDLDRLRDFVDFRALHPDRANEGGLGNLPGQLSPLEALGIWPTSDFRRSAAASSIPAIVFYAGALLAACALAFALPRWLRRHGPAVPAALLTAAILYVLALVFGTVYTSAKALAIAAPLITLITLGGLLARDEVNKGEGASQRKAAGRGARATRAGGWGSHRRRLRSMDARTPADMDVKPPAAGAPPPDRPPPRLPRQGLTGARLLGIAFAIAAAFSSFLILRQAPVSPEAHAAELAEIRPMIEGEKLLFLGRDNFVLYELRGSKPFTHVRNFYDPYFVEPNFDLEQVGSKFDFDSVTAETLARFPYVLTTRAEYASGPPPGYRVVARTESYLLWAKQKGLSPIGRQPAEFGPEPGRFGGCPETRPAQLAAFSEAPVVFPEEDWNKGTIENGSPATLDLELPRGAWDLSVQYDATRPVTLSGPDAGYETTLPGNLDYRGSAPYWPAGTIEIPNGEPIRIIASVEQPPLVGRLMGAHSVAHVGSVVATGAVDGRSPRPTCNGYVDWYIP